MIWVILAVFAVCLIANLPLLYNLFEPKRRAIMPALWGYAPHQFFFILVIFPFATFCAFTSIYITFSKLGPSLPDSFSGKWMFDNGVLLLLLGLVVIGALSVGDYMSSTRSFDKLRSENAGRAVATIRQLDDQIDRLPPLKRDEERELLVKTARDTKDALVLPPHSDAHTMASWVKQLPAPVYLQVTQDASLQRRLDLLDPGAYVLSTIQVVFSLFVAYCVLLSIAAAVIVHGSPDVPHAIKVGPAFEDLIKALFGAVAGFAFYPILFHQYRSEIEPLVGNNGTTMQHVFSGIMIGIILVTLTIIYPPQKEVSEAIAKVLPPLLIAVVFSVEVKLPLVVRQIVGSDANFGRQVSVTMIFILLSLVASFLIWPKR